MGEWVKHLEMIQGVINRMAQISFILKGWAITVVIAGLGIAGNSSLGLLGLITIISCFLFWGVDAYYLRQERLYRCLYNKVCLDSAGDVITCFSMDTDTCESEVQSWLRTMWRPTLRYFYATLIIMAIVVSIIIVFCD